MELSVLGLGICFRQRVQNFVATNFRVLVDRLQNREDARHFLFKPFQVEIRDQMLHLLLGEVHFSRTAPDNGGHFFRFLNKDQVTGNIHHYITRANDRTTISKAMFLLAEWGKLVVKIDHIFCMIYPLKFFARQTKRFGALRAHGHKHRVEPERAQFIKRQFAI